MITSCHVEGKGMDTATLAFKAGSMIMREAADRPHTCAGISRTNSTPAVVAAAMKSGCAKAQEEWAEKKGLPLPAPFAPPPRRRRASRQVLLFAAVEVAGELAECAQDQFREDGRQGRPEPQPYCGEETPGSRL